MTLVEARGFKPEDFARFHPEGSLGKRLLLRARDLMHAGDELPVVRVDQSLEDLLRTMTEKTLGLACIVDRSRHVLWVPSPTATFADWSGVVPDPMSLSAEEAFRMSRRETTDIKVKCSTIRPDMPLIDCRQIMRDSVITHLVVTDEQNRPVGIVRQQDIIAVGLG